MLIARVSVGIFKITDCLYHSQQSICQRYEQQWEKKKKNSVLLYYGMKEFYSVLGNKN